MSRWYSPALLPYVRHPHVEALGPLAAPELEKRALVRDLVKTRTLGTRIVAPLARQLASGSTPCKFGSRAKRGERLARDAEWHGRQIDTLMVSLGLVDAGDPPVFAVRLASLLRVHARDDDEAVLITLLFAVAAETAGPQHRVTLATDPQLHPDLREFFVGQARDLRWHADFFSARMRELWRQLSRKQRDRLGPLVPALIWMVHEPDRAAAVHDLCSVGLSRGEAVHVLAEAWPLERSQDDVREASGPTLAVVQRAGVLEHPLALVSFVEAGLLAV